MEKFALSLGKFFSRVRTWAKEDRQEFFIVLLILFLAAFVRLWRLPEYMTFLGDEGRDALVLKRMIVDHKFRLIGPVTSIGNMYLGPLYYYLILPSAIVFRLSPVGPAVFVALLGIATVFLIWLTGREWLGRSAGLVAAFLYALSPIVITYSISSWNPNVMPFFSLLTIWGIWRVWRRQQFYWLPIIGVTLSFALQSHYLGILLIPTVTIFWLLTLYHLFRKRQKINLFILYSLFLILIFSLLTVLPLVWFDVRHNFINLNAFKAFFGDRQTTVSIKLWKAFPKIGDLIEQIFTRLLTGKDIFWGKWASTIIALFLGLKIWLGWRKNGLRKFIERNKSLFLILVWFFIGLIGLGNYKQHIYDHYFGFFFPAPFLLTGWVLSKLGSYQRIGKILAAVSLIFLAYLSIKELPLRYPPNHQLARTQEVAKFVLENAQDKPFNLALIAERNYDDAYAYFMEIWGTPPLRIEPLKAKETIVDQLFVICEKLPCQPINHPKAEIAMFGWAKVDKKWELDGVEIYKLLHNYPSNVVK